MHLHMYSFRQNRTSVIFHDPTNNSRKIKLHFGISLPTFANNPHMIRDENILCEEQYVLYRAMNSAQICKILRYSFTREKVFCKELSLFFSVQLFAYNSAHLWSFLRFPAMCHKTHISIIGTTKIKMLKRVENFETLLQFKNLETFQTFVPYV